MAINLFIEEFLPYKTQWISASTYNTKFETQSYGTQMNLSPSCLLLVVLLLFVDL